jgi:hypothetical protein
VRPHFSLAVAQQPAVLRVEFELAHRPAHGAIEQHRNIARDGIAKLPVGFDRSRRCGGTRSNALNLGGGGLDNVGGRGFDQ